MVYVFAVVMYILIASFVCGFLWEGKEGIDNDDLAAVWLGILWPIVVPLALTVLLVWFVWRAGKWAGDRHI